MLSDELQTLGTVAAFSANVVDESPIRTDEEGNQTVEVDEAVVAHNRRLFSHIKEQLLEVCEKNGGADAKAKLTSLLVLMQSYIAFERVGKGISETRWKAAFRQELTQVYAQLCELCDGVEP